MVNHRRWLGADENDPEYEAWVLGYTIENRSVHFPFQASFLNVEKFGASIEEHHGEGIPMNTESPKSLGKGRIMVE